MLVDISDAVKIIQAAVRKGAHQAVVVPHALPGRHNPIHPGQLILTVADLAGGHKHKQLDSVLVCQFLQPLNFIHQFPDIGFRHRLIILHIIAHVPPGKQILVSVHAVIVVGRRV